MAPTVHCVRHAQGYHNISTENHKIQDPLLTPFGEQQCAELRDTFPHHDKICLLISSPLRRTIYTTSLAFSPALHNGRCRPNIIALPEIQETSDFPCDTGSDVGNLRKEMKEKHLPIDLSLVKEGWNVKTLGSMWSPSSEALTKRAREAREYIRDQIIELQRGGEEDPQVVVVTHGGFLHYFTEDWEDYRAYNGTGWGNTEFRSFTFDYDNATLQENEESRKRRGKVEPQHGREKQAELYQAAVQVSEKNGEEMDVEEEEEEGEEEDAGKEEGIEGLVRVLTRDSENTDKRGGEAPAMDRKGEAVVTDRDSSRRRSSAGMTTVAA